MSLQHVESRIAQRSLDVSPMALQALASQFEQDTAVILGKKVSDEGVRFGMVLIILIVRNRRPVTVMTRRETQNFTCANFNVKKIVRMQ